MLAPAARLPDVQLYNTEAEQALIGAIFVNNEAMNHVTYALKPSDFYVEAHQIIYDGILALTRASQVANAITLKKRLAGKVEDRYLAALTAASTSIINVREYANLILDLAAKRRLVGICEEAVIDARSNGEKTSGDIIEETERRLFDLAGNGAERGGFESITSTVEIVLTKAEQAFKNGGQVSGIPTGFGSLDTIMGGLRDSDLVIIAGRPSMGKTALAMNIAHHVAKGLNKGLCVGFFSLEMSREQLVQRLIGSESGVCAAFIQRGDLAPGQMAKVIEAGKRVDALPIMIDDTPALTISAIRTRARRLKRSRNMAALFVDYLQLIRPTTYGGQTNRVNEVTEITQGLKAIAKELNIPVVALSQLSREVEKREDKRPQLADLRDSGSIEQDADIVAFVYREEYYLRRQEPRQGTASYAGWAEACARAAGKAECIVAKNRNGPVDTAHLTFNGTLTQFGNVEGGI